jgi:hypothetical protein
LLTGVGIIALTSLLYVALRDTVRWAATVAFALRAAEATVLAASMLGLYALLDLDGTSVGSGSAVSASDDAVVGKFAIGLHEHAADIGMLFFSAGALLWYCLFVCTRFVLRWLGIWGLASVAPEPSSPCGQGPASADPALHRLRALRALRRDLAPRQGIARLACSRGRDEVGAAPAVRTVGPWRRRRPSWWECAMTQIREFAPRPPAQARRGRQQ